MTKKMREKANTGRLKHIKKPDVDNLVKFYMDCLSNHLFDDDCCVSLERCVKLYSHTPKTVIYIQDSEDMISDSELM